MNCYRLIEKDLSQHWIFERNRSRLIISDAEGHHLLRNKTPEVIVANIQGVERIKEADMDAYIDYMMAWFSLEEKAL